MKSLKSRIITTAILLSMSASFSFGQGFGYDTTALLNGILTNSEYQKEWDIIHMMRLQGKRDSKIMRVLEDKVAKDRAEAAKKIQKGDPLVTKQTEKDLFLASSCNSNDIGFELGTFGTWTGQTSDIATFSSTACLITAWANTTLPLTNRITIVPAPATDPCATVAVPIPLPSPSGGLFSVKLGNNSTGAQSERIAHSFIVQPSDTNFIYQYAVVFQDPGHIPAEQPFFDFVILAQNGDTIPCSFQHYTAGAGIPGFQVSTACSGSTNYKPWTTVGVNLGKYLNQQVTVVCTTGDCKLCGHYGYAYLDFSCGTTSSTQFCSGTNSVTVVAPTEVGATYTWNTIPVQTTQTVTVNPTVIDTLTVFVNPPAGCGYFVNYILKPTVIKPGFTYTVGCTTANFSDTTLITGGTISTWNWSFPGGVPSSATGQNPPTVTYPVGGGTHNVTLNIISQAGCTAATASIPIMLLAPPTVSAGANSTVCGGNPVTLNGSGTPAGGTYAWSPATNLNNTTIPNPVASPVTAPIAYTLTYTGPNGCIKSDVTNLAIGSDPIANANYSLELTCEGISVLFKDSSQFATSWFWDFGDGATSILQNPPVHQYAYNGTYNVTLTVYNGACRDSMVTPISIGDINSFIDVKAPNVFTPNNDGLNDCFKPIITGSAVTELEKCMTMEIFDRWGIKVFESTGGVGVCWDGKTKSNIKAKDGTYYYLIKIGGNTFKGYLTLVREGK